MRSIGASSVGGLNGGGGSLGGGTPRPAPPPPPPPAPARGGKRRPRGVAPPRRAGATPSARTRDRSYGGHRTRIRRALSPAAPSRFFGAAPGGSPASPVPPGETPAGRSRSACR